MPSNWGPMPEALELLCQHFVGLTWYQGETGEDGEFTQQPEWQAASAFIADVGGWGWLVTAGHVFAGFDKRREKSPSFKWTYPAVWDIWSRNAEVKQPAIFDFLDPDRKRLILYDTSKGVDLALLSIPRFLGNFVCRSITPFSRESWIESAYVEHDFYYMVGTPASLAEQEFTQHGERKSVTTYHRPTMIRLDRLDPENVEGIECDGPQFVARIHEGFPIPDISGMSGGPILGFRQAEDGNLHYWPVAVQSRWKARSRIVIGTLLSPWLAEFEQLLLEHESTAQP